MPDHPSLLQTYVWQNYDLFPKFPALKDFLAFWEEKLEGPLFSVTVAHSKLIKPAELRAVDGVASITSWHDVPPPSQALMVARDLIYARTEQFIRDLKMRA
jgi:uncharacterized protein Usg